MKKTWSRAVPYIAVLGLFVVLLQNFVSGQNVLLTTDAAIAASDRSFLDMLRMMVPYWSPNPLFGSGSAGGTSVAVCTLGIFPSGILWNNWGSRAGMFDWIDCFYLSLFTEGHVHR